MVTVAYNLIFVAVVAFAAAFVITGLIMVILVVLRRVTLKEAAVITFGSALLAGSIVAIGWSLLGGPDSLWITAPESWLNEILSQPLNPWQPK